ncbi:amidase [Elioraea tepida]|jgi:aspartyl-tRNA(Asn)/glutamyl-tRNA(Gln) amidotransferase subunit A|uniref:Amidase n=1 Tax=Elioraea tepida TaxID=2843330 RepID=A0A975U218_9PROT|nr:amidase [Elioraea tepida]QXM24902.1 amidase [Elioraea tepida]
MTSAGILGLGIGRLAEAIRKREISAVAAAEASLAALERWQPHLNAVARPRREAALAAAERIDAAIARGEPVGPLAGVPMAHKDMFYRAGELSECGAKLRRGHVPATTSTALACLDAAGAVQVAWLNMAEFAFNPTGHNDHTGHVRNPWNPAHITGGSSSGSGAAVAARATLAALGSDTGGSIRLPAAICGITGLKPTWGLVSRHGAMPLSASLDTVGPLAVSAHDVALVTQAIAGADPLDPDCAARPAPDFLATIEGGARGLVIGVARGFLWEGVHEEVRVILEDALAAWRAAGATVVEVEAPGLAEIRTLVGTIILAESAALHAAQLRDHADDYTQAVRTRLETGLAIPAATYLDALRARKPLTEAFCRTVFSRCDALFAPVLLDPVPTIAESDAGAPTGARWQATIPRNTRLFNYLGLPALSLPSGFTRNGLPAGHQIVGRPFDEPTLFRLGHAFQNVTDWHLRAPAPPA